MKADTSPDDEQSDQQRHEGPKPTAPFGNPVGSVEASTWTGGSPIGGRGHHPAEVLPGCGGGGTGVSSRARSRSRNCAAVGRSVGSSASAAISRSMKGRLTSGIRSIGSDSRSIISATVGA